jgi:hypothetical protein
MTMILFKEKAVREWVWVVGRDIPDQEYILSDYDSWEKNPFYLGKPGRHPEDYDCEYDEEVGVGYAKQPVDAMIIPTYTMTFDEDIPF